MQQLLASDGDVGSLTVEAVAARAGAAKTTIYRRWRDKWQLALDAVMIDMPPARQPGRRRRHPQGAADLRQLGGQDAGHAALWPGHAALRMIAPS